MDGSRSETSIHRILVVDDEEIVLVALRDTLRREGYQVVTAPSAVQALAILKEQMFSVIITDQQMPVLTGLEFLAQVKQSQPDATRILITAVLNLSTMIDAINKGEIYRFVVKPWLREELLATVRNAVQRYELICKNAVLQAATLAMNEKLSQLNKTLEEQLAKEEDQKRRLEQANKALAQNLEQSVELCLRTMQTFYPTLGSQARRVYELCRAMAEVLKLSPPDRQTLEISAWLHDIGLVGVPRQLIRRWELDSEGLNAAERAVVEQHPLLGQDLASFVNPLQSVGLVIRAHHERYDGKGYPDGLAADNIPWLARLLSVACAYAESSAEPHLVLDRIRQESGSAFDPQAVSALLRCLPRAEVPRRQRQVSLSELEPGMVLAKGIYTANGLLLIPDGQRLTVTYIDKLRNHHRINPISQNLLVYC